MILSSALQAIGLFIATNIDDIIVLSLFFARGAGQRGTTARILVGQYLGFIGILGAAVLVSLGAGAFLPPQAIPYFGLIPLGLGLWAAWQAWRGDDAEGLDPSGNDGLLPAISGRREDFPQPAVRCGTDGLRAGVVNPPGLTCAALPLTSEGRQRIKR